MIQVTTNEPEFERFILLTDEQMARFQRSFPKSHGRERGDDWQVLSGIIFASRNGLR